MWRESAGKGTIWWNQKQSDDFPSVEYVRSDLAAAREKRLREALEELLECADLRGDSELPHPADDPKRWTARMQEAWDDCRAALAETEKPNA